MKPSGDTKSETVNNGKDTDEKLLDIDDDDSNKTLENTNLSLTKLNLDSQSMNRDTGLENFLKSTQDKELDDFFSNINSQSENSAEDKLIKKSPAEIDQTKLDESLTQLDLAMDSFTGSGGFDFTNSPLFNPQQQQQQPPLDLLTSESVALFEEILNTRPSTSANDWEITSGDTFLPPGILKQSLGAATLGTSQKEPVSSGSEASKVRN